MEFSSKWPIGQFSSSQRESKRKWDHQIQNVPIKCQCYFDNSNEKLTPENGIQISTHLNSALLDWNRGNLNYGWQ